MRGSSLLVLFRLGFAAADDVAAAAMLRCRRCCRYAVLMLCYTWYETSAIEALKKEEEDEERRWRTQRRAHPTSPGALCAPDVSLVHLMVRKKGNDNVFLLVLTALIVVLTSLVGRGCV